jgi:hypothetical protein
MRPVREYHALEVADLEVELSEVHSLLLQSMEQLAKARTALQCDNLTMYWQSTEDSHAARQRFADYNTQTQFADVIEFEQLVAAYRVNYDTLIAMIAWRHNERSASRL